MRSQICESATKMHSMSGALGTLGFSGVGHVRQGKVFDIELDHDDRARAETELKAMAEKLLANTVIEDYTVSIT